MALVYVAAQTYNRPVVSRRCLMQQAGVMPDGCTLHIWDDHSTDPVNLDGIDHVAHKEKARLGIHKLRATQLSEFVASGDDLVYLTDCDAVLDPLWLDVAISLLDHGEIACLFNSAFHRRFTLWEGENPPHYKRIYAPGISYLMARGTVQRIAHKLHSIEDEWDFRIPAMLGNQCVVSKASYCDHYGAGGMHTPPGRWDRDMALSPTPYLSFLRNTLLETIKKESK